MRLVFTPTTVLMGSFAIPIPILWAADVRCRVCQFFIKCIEKKQKKLVNLPNSRHCSSKHYLFGWGRELAGRILTIVVAAVLIQRMRLAACHVEHTVFIPNGGNTSASSGTLSISIATQIRPCVVLETWE